MYRYFLFFVLTSFGSRWNEHLQKICFVKGDVGERQPIAGGHFFDQRVEGIRDLCLTNVQILVRIFRQVFNRIFAWKGKSSAADYLDLQSAMLSPPAAMMSCPLIPLDLMSHFTGEADLRMRVRLRGSRSWPITGEHWVT